MHSSLNFVFLNFVRTSFESSGQRLILLALVDEGLVDVGDHTTTGNGGLDEGIELLVSTNGELKMAWCDALHLEVLGGISGQLEHLGGEVLKDGGAVHGSGGSNATVLVDAVLEESVDPSDWELKSSLCRPGDCLAWLLLLSFLLVSLNHIRNDHICERGRWQGGRAGIGSQERRGSNTAKEHMVDGSS
eukprot:TRINITY_DN6126_c0_g1_i4.p1 TRINITY_DN6126_c0_g1~~TRINITY_DN6126_c0_g1_i4.p1  ORF type:complete len:189 (+),score=7.94 TRINITY_DN6126_c0_g1_i4:325-891(+)